MSEVQVKFRLVRNKLDEAGCSPADVKAAMNNVQLDMDHLETMQTSGSSEYDFTRS